MKKFTAMFAQVGKKMHLHNRNRNTDYAAGDSGVQFG